MLLKEDINHVLNMSDEELDKASADIDKRIAELEK